MNFAAVKAAANALGTRLANDTGRQLFQAMTIEEPVGSEDELHFFRLVHWSYILINEAANVPLKHLISLVRVSGGEALSRVGTVRQAVHVLRTVNSHNLAGDENGADKMRRARVWLTEHGGEPTDWKACCIALCSGMVDLLNECETAWKRAVETQEDRAIAVTQLLQAVERSWSPHQFDALVQEAASALNLEGFDVSAYRDANIEQWRSFALYFVDRRSAEDGIRRAIRTELRNRFGD